MGESPSTDFLMLNGLPGSGNMLCINAIQKINGLKYLEAPQWFTTPAFPTELIVAAQRFSFDLDSCLQVTFPGKSASDVQLTHPYRALHSFTHEGFWYGLKLKNYMYSAQSYGVAIKSLTQLTGSNLCTTTNISSSASEIPLIL